MKAVIFFQKLWKKITGRKEESISPEASLEQEQDKLYRYLDDDLDIWKYYTDEALHMKRLKGYALKTKDIYPTYSPTYSFDTFISYEDMSTRILDEDVRSIVTI